MARDPFFDYNPVPYDLMNKDDVLVTFEFDKDSRILEHTIKINPYSVKFSTHKKEKFPFALRKELTSQQLELWLNMRPLPVGRKHYGDFLIKYGLVGRFNFLIHGMALSLNDTFWIKMSDLDVKWKDVNFYKHGFSTRTSQIALGNLAFLDASDTTSSPDLTTDGVLEKFWKRREGKTLLFKGGENHQVREYIVSKILDETDIPHIKYGLIWNKKTLLSQCECFTTESLGLVSFYEAFISLYPYDQTITYDKVLEVYKYYKVSTESLKDMILIDFIIRNTDRHYKNFGFTYDNNTGIIKESFPLFDHGNSFLHSFYERAGEVELDFGYSLLKEEDLYSLFQSILDKRRTRILQSIQNNVNSGKINKLLTDLLKSKFIDDSEILEIPEWINQICTAFLGWRKQSYNPEFKVYKDPRVMCLF